MEKVIRGAAAAVYLAAVLVLVIIVCMGAARIAPSIVVSGSMEPHIPTGSLVLIDCKDTDAETGDVIGYELGKTLVVHRVVDIEKGYYITKGDNNDNPDFAPVDPDRVKGTVVMIVPYAGYAVRFFAGPGLMLVLAAAVCLLIASCCLGKQRHKWGHNRRSVRNRKVI